MFERYTEKARRSIFFARAEASTYGSPYIETEHLLLGLLREDKTLTDRLLRSNVSAEAIRGQVEQHTPQRAKIFTSIDLPLSTECKHALTYAADEAAQLSHNFVGTEHLLLGLLREQGSFAEKLLHSHGLSPDTFRHELRQTATPPQSFSSGSSAPSRVPPLVSSLGYSTHTLKIADLPSSVEFYRTMGFRRLGTGDAPGIALLAHGFIRVTLYEHDLAERLLCLYGGDLERIAAQLRSGGVMFETYPQAGAPGESTALLVHDPDGNVWYFRADRGDEDNDDDSGQPARLSHPPTRRRAKGFGDPNA